MTTIKTVAVFAMALTFGAGSLFAQAPPPPRKVRPRNRGRRKTFRVSCRRSTRC